MKDRATKHAEDVAAGKIQSGELHRLACQRHLRDLERQGTPEFPFVWDEKKSESILSFAELLTIAEGAGARKHAREWNYITNAENALQRLAGRFYGGMENENTAL